MKYYLIIGYRILEKHLESPTVKVYVNDNLLDEFLCDNEEAKDIKTVFSEKLTSVGTAWKYDMENLHTINFETPKSAKIFEIETNHWGDKSNLKIEVTNNKSNYTNGFMSKKSMVIINPVYLVPKDLFDDKSKMHRIIKRTAQLKGKTPAAGFLKSKKYLSRNRIQWPGFCLYPDHRQFASYGTVLKQGGDFEINFNIQKKHRVYVLSLDTNLPIGYFFTDDFFYAWYQWYSKYYFTIYGEGKVDHDKSVQSVSTTKIVKDDKINT